MRPFGLWFASIVAVGVSASLLLPVPWSLVVWSVYCVAWLVCDSWVITRQLRAANSHSQTGAA